MEGHCVGLGTVDAFDDVDFTHRRPLFRVSISLSRMISELRDMQKPQDTSQSQNQVRMRGGNLIGKITYVGSHEPESGPNTADTSWHMGNVCQKEALVVCFLAGDTNTLAARVRSRVVVDAHVRGVAVVAHGTYHFVLHCGCIVNVLHEAGRGVRLREWRESVEEIIAFVGIGEDIASYAHAEEGCESEQAGESVGRHIGMAA